MRLCPFCLLLSPPLVAQPTPDAVSAAARTARLEGQILSQAGEPLRKATVRLQPYGTDFRSNAINYVDTTDTGGKFVFEGVLPGRYSLSAEHTGFLGQAYGAKSFNAQPGMLTLAAGQILKDITLKLIPQGAITGRVTDADGDPIQGLQVWTLRISRFRGQRRASRNSNVATDDQGNFRIANLAPGSYYLLAEDRQMRSGMFSGPPMTTLPGRAPNRVKNVDTYYLDAADSINATPLDITPGSELRGIEIQMRREAVFSIRGAVADAAGKPVVASVNAQASDDSETRVVAQGTSAADGTFELRNVRAGAYVVAASPGNNPDMGVAREEVSITDSDIAGVKLTLAQGATVAGTIKLDGKGTLGAPLIILAGMGAIGISSTAQAKEDGTFELHGVVPANYVAAAVALPEGAYVKSVHFAGQDVTRMPIDLTSGVSGTLDILISPRGAELLGAVRNQDGAAIPGVKVTCWPKNDSPYNLVETCGSVTDQNGDFRMADLAPGDYYILAWEELDPGLTDDPEFLRRFSSQATLVTVEEGSHQSVLPKLISREAAAAEAAKLQ